MLVLSGALPTGFYRYTLLLKDKMGEYIWGNTYETKVLSMQLGQCRLLSFSHFCERDLYLVKAEETSINMCVFIRWIVEVVLYSQPPPRSQELRMRYISQSCYMSSVAGFIFSCSVWETEMAAPRPSPASCALARQEEGAVTGKSPSAWRAPPICPRLTGHCHSHTEV